MGPRPTENIGSEKWMPNNISCELFLKWKLLVFNGTFSEISHQNEANSLCLQTTTKKNVKIFSLRRCKHGMFTDVKFVNFFPLYFQCYTSLSMCFQKIVGTKWKTHDHFFHGFAFKSVNNKPLRYFILVQVDQKPGKTHRNTYTIANSSRTQLEKLNYDLSWCIKWD